MTQYGPPYIDFGSISSMFSTYRRIQFRFGMWHSVVRRLYDVLAYARLSGLCMFCGELWTLTRAAGTTKGTIQ